MFIRVCQFIVVTRTLHQMQTFLKVSYTPTFNASHRLKVINTSDTDLSAARLYILCLRGCADGADGHLEK